MKYIFLIFLIFLLTSCSKPKTVLICGDHVCLNKAEAELYFEENLTLEVKIIDKKVNKNAPEDPTVTKMLFGSILMFFFE